MKWADVVADYLSFSRRELIGILALVFIITVILLLPGIISQQAERSPSEAADTSWIAAARSLELHDSIETDGEPDNRSNYQYDRPVAPTARGSLFYFDPNTMDEAGWQKLGLREKTIKTIMNYTRKGGKFKHPGDLQRIYGLRKAEFDRLEPYIRIATVVTPASAYNYEKAEKSNTVSLSRMVEINSADTSSLIALPGIGSKLAARIIKFRDKLGGFYAIEQVAEVYGLKDSTFQVIRKFLSCSASAIVKLNINAASIDQLKNHPYLNYSIAGAIIAYRNEHGPFANPGDLRRIMVITDDLYEKLSPYIVCE